VFDPDRLRTVASQGGEKCRQVAFERFHLIGELDCLGSAVLESGIAQPLPDGLEKIGGGRSRGGRRFLLEAGAHRGRLGRVSQHPVGSIVGEWDALLVSQRE
jgi:hypothetical protein